MSVKATINELLVRFGFIRPDVPVQDAAGTPPKPSKTYQSLQAHDKQYHPNGWKPGDKCRLRDSIFNVDDMMPASSPSTQQSQAGQQQQQAQPNNQDFPTESEFEAVIELVKDNPRLVPPALKQVLDDLPKKIFDLAENQEYLDDAIADLPDGDAKNSLLADQQALEKERMKLRGEFLQTYRVLSSILGTAKPTVLKRNPPLPHDVSAFPTKLDSVPVVNQDGSVDISFDGASYHFTPCQNGSTGAVEGTINVNGQPKKFILKISNKPGIKHAVPAEALKNEQAASEMLRKAGVNTPDSMVFEKNGEVYKLAEFIDNATPISQATITDDIRNQIKAAYPLLDLMYSTDLLKDDNVRVDQKGKVWFVDNGSAFAFKGYGDKKTTANKRWKGFDFEQRNDAGGAPLPGNDGKGGTAMYPSHYGALYESQKKIQAILGRMTTKDLLKEASRYNMTALVAGLPKESKCQALEEFAASLDKLSAKAAGTRKLKSSLRTQKAQPAQAQVGQQQAQQSAQAQQNVLIPINVKSMPQDVANALAAGGINLKDMTEITNSGTYPDHWYIDNYPNSQGISASIGASLPSGYSVGWYNDQGNQGLVVCATANKPKVAGQGWAGSWPSGGFQGWTDGTATTQPAQGTAAQTQQQPAWGATAQSQSAKPPPMTLTSRKIPPAIVSLLNNLGLQGVPYSVWNNNYSHQMFDIALPGQALNTSALQSLANQLPQGMSVTTHSNGNAHIINTSDYYNYWRAYNHNLVKPTTSTPASNQASTPSQRQTSSKPAPASTSSGSGSSTASSGGTKTYSYGSSGSLVKSGGFNDGNVATDISTLISSSNLMSAKGKTLLAPGMKLKTQGSLANNGDLYIGLPAGIQKSDLQSIAAQLTNEYQQYGYRAYPMGGSWISVEPLNGVASKPAQTTASAPTASTPSPSPTYAATATPAATPSSTTSTAAASATPPPSSAPVASTPSQPASTTPTASTPVSTPAAAVRPAQSITSNPTARTTPRRTLSQMLQQRMATANPNLKAAFQAAYNRANGNSGIAQTPTSTATASQQPQTASQTSGQPATPSVQQAQQTSPAPLLTAPKSGNTPTPTQQKVINRFKRQIAANPPPAVVKALQAALSRYYSSI